MLIKCKQTNDRLSWWKSFWRFDIIDLSEGIDLAQSMLKNVWFAIIGFLNHEFEFQDSVCNGCYDLLMLSVNTSKIAIIIIKNVDYRCIFITLANAKQLIY